MGFVVEIEQSGLETVGRMVSSGGRIVNTDYVYEHRPRSRGSRNVYHHFQILVPFDDIPGKDIAQIAPSRFLNVAQNGLDINDTVFGDCKILVE